MERDARCWAEVDLGALRHNFRLVKRCAGGAAVMAVVKADAYGHGDAAVAPLLEREGADAFAVACLGEALRLRRVGVTRPVLILGRTGAESAAALAENGIRQAVFSPEYAEALSGAASRAGVTVRVHIKVDTGMARLGFSPEDTDGIARACALPGLFAEGIFTHFAAADSIAPQDREYTRRQYALFDGVLRALAARGVRFPLRHCCNSAGTFAWPEYRLDMVRPGIILYGEQPSDTVTLPGLRGALRLCAAVSQVRTLRAGDAVSYGCTFRTTRPSRIGVLPIGYADGLHRVLSNQWQVWTPWGTAPIVGRICMDMCMVDLTGLPQVREGGEVEVYGARNSVNEAARLAGTIAYELTCAVSRRVPRVYCRDGREVARELLLRG